MWWNDRLVSQLQCITVESVTCKTCVSQSHCSKNSDSEKLRVPSTNPVVGQKYIWIFLFISSSDLLKNDLWVLFSLFNPDWLNPQTILYAIITSLPQPFCILAKPSLWLHCLVVVMTTFNSPFGINKLFFKRI